ncbi:iron-containing alcohol dehydrogenase [uncultured Eubacterium sp.]|uniref:iron-containing alcohol dehydrogenase n=1 Tax=uncultured Eubacterium sp. TaxID=165185 RepID=UPI002616D4CD|nr:iron-containing alcohol dehydrogenase [uncultured Eubacterium sp.]
MYNFEYYTPTFIEFGKKSEEKVAQLIKAQNCKKVLIHYGGHSAKKSGLIDKIEKLLTEENIPYVELGGVVPNPRLSLVYKGIELAKKENVDFILAVGGGSVIDSAKAIGYGIANEGDVWDFYAQKRVTDKCAPVGVVLTIAAAGSEMSNSSVITNDETGLKRSYHTEISRPRFAIMNPEFTMTLPEYQTACGCTDIMMHTMERYFTAGETMELTDKIAESVMQIVLKNAPILLEQPDNYESRAEVMWAGSLSHNGLTGCGIKSKDFATHMLEHELGGVYDVAHGAGLAAVWGSWARYVYKECLGRFKKFAINVMNVEEVGSDEEIALKGIEAMEKFYHSIGMPTSIKELGLDLTDADIEKLADQCCDACGGHKGSAKVLYREDIVKIYKMAR